MNLFFSNAITNATSYEMKGFFICAGAFCFVVVVGVAWKALRNVLSPELSE